jgi:SnoaL-like domain
VSAAAITYAEVVEQVRATLAALAHAQDDGRTDDLVALYTADGGVEVPGVGTFKGAQTLSEAFVGWKPAKPQRHMIVNTVVTEWDDDHAKATSDVVFVQRGETGWAVQVVSRYYDTFRNHGGKWLLHWRSMQFIM